MHKPRTLLLGTFAAALLVGAVAAPMAAAKTKLAIVNGMAGKKVDVCVNGREIKSGLKYGRFVLKKTRTAKATVKFYKRDPRKCGGKLLAKKTSGLDDATFVVTRRRPLKVVVFDNAGLAQPLGPGNSVGGYRHAADVGSVTFAYDFATPTPTPIDLSADTSTKGEKSTDIPIVALSQIWSTFVTQGAVEVVAPHLHWINTPLRRWELILVGRTVENARLVFIDRPGTPA